MITLSKEAVGRRVAIVAESSYRNTNGTVVGISRDRQEAIIELDGRTPRGKPVRQKIGRQHLAWIRERTQAPHCG